MIIRTTGALMGDDAIKRLEAIKNKVLQENSVKKEAKRQRTLSSLIQEWERIVRSKFPYAFFGSYTATQKTIFKNIAALYENETKESFSDLLEWTVTHWTRLADITKIKFFETKPYPCLVTFCKNYKAIVDAKFMMDNKVVIANKTKPTTEVKKEKIRKRVSLV